MYGDDGHHGAANSAAFARAISDDGRPVPIDGTSLTDTYRTYRPFVEVDAAGEPTGGIHEGARALLRPDWIKDMMNVSGDLDAKMARIAKVLATQGITTIQDAAVTPAMLDAFGRLETDGDMSFRLRAAMMEPERSAVDEIAPHLAKLAALRQQYAGYRYVHADGVKLFADAVLEGNPLGNPPVVPVAAVLGRFQEPIFSGSLENGDFELLGYVDQDSAVCADVRATPSAYTDTDDLESFRREFGFYPRQCIPKSGVLEHDEAFIRRYIREATEAGFHVHVHALSDKAVRITVDEFARVKTTADRLGTTQSMAHLQLVHPDDQKRMGELGITGVFTFAWAAPDVEYDVMVRPFIDKLDGLDDLYRPDGYYIENLYPARSVQRYGALVVHGSDAPVDTRDPRPFVNLLQAIYRSNGEVVMNAAERLDIASAIEAFTINGARLFRHDDDVGSIEVGKLADLIAIDRNLVELAAGDDIEAIADTEVLMTVFEGRVIHDRTRGEARE
jgi:predicted amidohydrolase YtcJ